MRLLLSSFHFAPSIGGVERQSRMLVGGLVRRGHQVDVITAAVPGAPEEEELDGARVVRVRAAAGSRYLHMGTYLARMSAVALRLGRDADVLQVQQALYPAAAMAAVSLVLRKPLVVSNRGSGRFGAVQVMRQLPLGRASLRLIAARATCVGLSDEMMEEMRSAGVRRLVEIPNGVSLPPPADGAERAAARRELGLSGPVAIFVGRLDGEKNLDLLVDGFARAGPLATLVVVGDGPERERMQALAAASGAGERIRFLGARPDVRRPLVAADVFVLPSYSEGISNALLEAMAHGVPAIATAVGGNRRVIGDASVGTLVPPGDPAALGTALRGLLGDPVRAAGLGAAGRRHVEQNYSADAMVRAYEALYARLT